MKETLKKVKKQIKITGIAGGVGLNCSLNGKIHNSKIFKNIFQPALEMQVLQLVVFIWVLK